MGICTSKKQDNATKPLIPQRIEIQTFQPDDHQVSDMKMEQQITTKLSSLTDFDPIYAYLTNQAFTDSIASRNSISDLCRNPNYKNGNQMVLLSLKISNCLGRDRVPSIKFSFAKKILYKFNAQLRPALSELSQQVNLDEKLTLDCLIATVETFHVLQWQENHKWFDDQQIQLDLESQYICLCDQINSLVGRHNNSNEKLLTPSIDKNKSLIDLNSTKEEKQASLEELMKNFLDTLYAKSLKEIQFIELNEEIIEFENDSQIYLDIHTSEVNKQAIKTYRPK